MNEGTNEGNVPGVHVPLKGLGGTSGGALAAMVPGRRLGADVGPRGTSAALGCPILLGGPCIALGTVSCGCGSFRTPVCL